MRYTLRTCARNPGLAGVILLTLALGIGANTAIFSIIDGVLLKPLPYRDPEGLVRLVEHVSDVDPGGNTTRRQVPPVPLSELPLLRERVRLLSDIGAYAPTAVTLASEEGALRVPAARVSPATLTMLGRSPLVGRLFDERDEVTSAEPVAILSYAAWRDRWRGDPTILGRFVVLDGRTFTVVGVMPRSFHFPDPQTQVWTPLAPSGRGHVPLIARVRDGISRQAAADEFIRVMRELRGDTDVKANDPAAAAFDLVSIQEALVAPVRPALRVLSVAVVVVLFICCVNVASLLLARAFVRQPEIAIRRVLGASRAQVFRQVLTECLLFALVAGVAGIGLAFAGLDLFRHLATSLTRRDLGPGLSIPRLDEVVLDTRVLIVTTVVSIGAGLLFGLLPALWHARTDSLRAAESGSRGSRPWARQATLRVLVIAEIALAMTLVMAATLQMYSFLRLSHIDPGYDATNVLTFQIVRSSGSARVTLGDEVVTRIRSLPDVQDAGYAAALPMIQSGFRGFLMTAPGPPPPPPRPGEDGPSPGKPDVRMVSPDFLRTLRVRLVAGRGFSERGPETPGARELLINRKLADSGYLGPSPIGRQVFTGPSPSIIVGIVDDIRQFGLDREPEPQIFSRLPGTRGPEYYAVRTNGTPTTIIAGIRRIVGELEPGATIDQVATMEQILSSSVARPRLYAAVLGVFAAMAGAIAAVGLYAVVAYAVMCRTREIGIRIAIGARPADVRRLVLGEAFALSGAGILLGAIGAVALNRSLSTTLYGIAEIGPMPYVFAAASFAALVLVASYVAAGPALRVDPVIALRAE